MNFRIQLIAIVLSVCMLASIFELVRKRRLREEYSLVWLLAGLCFLILSVWRDLIPRIGDLMGVSYSPLALFIIAFFFGMLLAIHFSLILSALTERVRILVQQNALLGLQVGQLQQELSKEREAKADQGA
jgi:hypothetical protein